jgi:hypothetical protein
LIIHFQYFIKYIQKYESAILKNFTKSLKSYPIKFSKCFVKIVLKWCAFDEKGCHSGCAFDAHLMRKFEGHAIQRKLFIICNIHANVNAFYFHARLFGWLLVIKYFLFIFFCQIKRKKFFDYQMRDQMYLTHYFICIYF